MSYTPRVEIKAPSPRSVPYGLESQIEWLTDAALIGVLPGQAAADRWAGNITWRNPDYSSGERYPVNPEDSVEVAAIEAASPLHLFAEGGTKLINHRSSGYKNRDAFAVYRREQESIGAETAEIRTAHLNELFDREVQFYLEEELYRGHGGGSTGFSNDPGLINLTAGTWGSLAKAVADLEAEWAYRAKTLPTLHIPRFAYPLLLEDMSDFFEKVDGKLYTLAGTPIILGSGYENLLPDGTHPTLGGVMMHMTGPVFGFKGERIEFSGLQGADLVRDLNDNLMTVEQEYVLGWSESPILACGGRAS